MEQKIAHLNMIQGIINRMASNSFLLKGWSVTLISALFVLATQSQGRELLYLTILPSITFWGLDGYFLRQERLYRKLYQDVSQKKNEDIDFSMNANIFRKSKENMQGVDNWFNVTKSKTLLAFHFPILCIIILSLIITNYSC